MKQFKPFGYKIFILQVIIWASLSGEIFAQNNFTIEQVMSSGFPSNLTTSFTGDFVAWVENKEGIKNIYIIDNTGAARKITSFAKDDGQHIGDLIFSPDNKYLFFVKGGSLNQNEEILKIDIKSNSLRLVSEGSSPALSHNGKILAFINRGQVWKVDLSTEKSPELFFTDRGSAGSLTWSPDDTKIAFVSHRGDHSFIGVYHPTIKKMTYLSPSVDNDVNPVWAADSKRLAHIKIPSESIKLLFMPQRTGPPWSIHVGNSETGTSTEIWKATEGTGSVFQSITADSQLFWTENDRLVFPWEASGWIHLYSIKSDGSSIKTLTAGKSEVKFASMSNDKKIILYSSNQGDIDRQHIWKVNIAGGKAEQLSSGDGVEWSPKFSASNNKLFILASGATSPAYPAILENKTIKSLKSEPDNSEFPETKLVKPEQIIVTATDGMQIHGQLFLPSNIKEGKKYPAVIFLHGGSRQQMLLGFHHKEYYHNTYAFNQYLTNRGYIVMSVNYRSGTGYGMKFREALNFGAKGASEFQDILGAGLYLKNRNDVDTNRIGLWGGSYGGYLTAMGLAKASNLFTAGVDVHGVHNWNVVIRNFIPDYNPLKFPKIAKLAYDSSPIAYVEDWKSPVLVIHGDDDRNVPFSEAVTLVEALRKNNVYVEQLIFPDEVHEFLLHSTWLKTFNTAFDFLERKLKNK
ncbi:MAG: S9 family peptidase [Deltaproteobacteria bacterium]|nr:S9 family peptidase [Deltaproteobacteria bacterium]